MRYNCGKAGKAAYDTGDTMHQSRLRGRELRRMLHRTAAAITALGVESISFRELTLRARLRDEERQALVDKSKRDRPWTRLMISFYFKGGGEHHGCEFLHKGFREYLFAEGIVETVKDYARRQRGEVERRSRYWEDFPRRDEQEGDQRWALSRALGELVSPNWLTSEVAAHVERLIAWEVERSDAPPASALPREETEPLPMEGWEMACDLLAELWEWWGEGVHLRPQPERDDDNGQLVLKPPFAVRLADLAMPRDRHGEGRRLPIPVRTITVDAHLGDGLFQLTVLAHYYLARKQGWNFEWQTASTYQSRQYQCICGMDDRRYRVFAPSGRDPNFFKNYAARINATGWRPVPFPGRTPMLGVWFAGCDLFMLDFESCRLNRACLRDAWCHLGVFFRADLSECDLRRAYFGRAVLMGARLEGAAFERTDLSSASLEHASSLTAAQLESAVIDAETKLPAKMERPKPRSKYAPTPSPPPVP